ncbi:hypothetical protein D9758_015168 [Tetrapyrgos nigripes]|uniref:Transposase n=1 Tax=Tetrapyrgos nigripes TaxID=182062 RepID=A0A8H5CPL1_9AGAR|nr:hypothetical protein D9758_015168 [Tetrapyrgos nigripes]
MVSVKNSKSAPPLLYTVLFVMSINASVCGGCGKSYPGGFIFQHCRKSRNPACQAYGKQFSQPGPTLLETTANLLGSLLSNLTAMPQAEQIQMGIPMQVDPTGDFFGSYDGLQDDIDISLGEPHSGPSVHDVHDSGSINDSDCDDSDEEDEAQDEQYEDHWEPRIDIGPHSHTGDRLPSPELLFPDGMLEETVPLPNARPPPVAHSGARTREPYVKPYPDPRAGTPLSSQTLYIGDNQQYRERLGDRSNIWAPFQSEMDWRIAKWAKMRGPSSTAFDELLAIQGVYEKLGLSYCNAIDLNKIIDNKLPNGRPPFQREEVIVQGHTLEVYFRDILQCVRALYGDADFSEYLKYAPEQHFDDSTCCEQLYHDMHTGRWWWSTQEKLDKTAGPGRTIIPIIISSDKTQVTVFHNKTAYPVYMTLGNIPKEIRRKPSKRAYILLGYLPSSNLEHIKNAASRRRSVTNLFHSCMRHIMKPLESAGSVGSVFTSGDGVDRIGHPIFAAFVGDYPEQILVTCCISGHCPRCTIPRQRIGDNTEPHPLWRLRSILEALKAVDQGAAAFVSACQEVGIKPVFEPFWSNLPYSNVYHSITPDILHQLYQGVFKHMKLWVIEAYGAHETDARCRRLPPNHNIRVFMKGISTLQRVSGEEHNQISHFLLGLIADAPLPSGMSNVWLLRCLRGLIDFLFLAQYPVHSTTSLRLLEDALERFHANKQIFVDLDIRSNFHIPKIHFLNHYVECVKQLGTFDNFNTEYTERLHIDMAKDAYWATNKKDEFSQMTKWLERKEKIMKHESYILWMELGEHPPLYLHHIPPGLNTSRILKMAKHPSVNTLNLSDVVDRYGATFLRAALSRYVVQLKNPQLTGRRFEDAVDALFLGVPSVSAYHRVKYLRYDVFSETMLTADSIHAQPGRRDKYDRWVDGRFDTALVHITDNEGPLKLTQDTRVAQKSSNYLFNGVPENDRPRHLAYVEWFSPFTPHPDENNGYYKISRSYADLEGGRLASVVDIRRLRQAYVPVI